MVVNVVVLTVAPTGVTSSAPELKFHRMTRSRIGHLAGITFGPAI